MKKITFYSELSYVFGVIVLAFGAALMAAADCGVSMVVAPAYLLHLKLSETFSFFTFGMAEYCLQALLILLVCAVLRRFRISYLFSFVTALLYGFLLDAAMLVTAGFTGAPFPVRVLLYGIGMLCSSLGVSLLFHTYISPEAYELVVKEISGKFGFDIHKCKTVYDCISCAVSVVLSFCFFGWFHFEGVKWGTILCALLNGTIIGGITGLLERRFCFCDRLPQLRRFFA
ncbi:MAG: DUF6198 family protein [Eubacteriales bacterium]